MDKVRYEEESKGILVSLDSYKLKGEVLWIHEFIKISIILGHTNLKKKCELFAAILSCNIDIFLLIQLIVCVNTIGQQTWFFSDYKQVPSIEEQQELLA